MTAYKNINAYKKSFGNVDKLNQVIMLYDTAIASLQQARQAIVDKNLEEKFNKIEKVFLIITGLRDSLDLRNGGDVAAVLAEWYNGTVYRILHIGQSGDLALCDMCIEQIKRMRTAWEDTDKQLKSDGNAGDNQSDEGFADNNNSADFFETIAKAANTGINSGMSISV